MAQPEANVEAFAKAYFDETYKKAVERKRLFKEYLSRNQVMEKLNEAVEKLYEVEQLPDDPVQFVADYITRGKPKKVPARPGSGSGR